MERDAGRMHWAVGRSAAIELDMALSVAGWPRLRAELPEQVLSYLESLPPDWCAQRAEMLGEERALVSILENAAAMAGVLQEGDYARATLAMRELRAGDALARLAEQARPLGLTPDPGLEEAARLADLATRLSARTYMDLGFAEAALGPFMRRAAADIARTVRILPGGDLHARFWHWLDRFYYGFYGPWREGRAEQLGELEARALTALGGREGSGLPPALSWLPRQSPLLRQPELQAAVQAGRVDLLFLVEPFGLSDLWSLQPGLLTVSFAGQGELYERFEGTARDLARRTRALSDPTRLVILRIIRHLGMVNTEMAEYLGLARPTVSIHAKILREAGLIRSRPDGRLVRHEIVPGEVRRLLRELEQFLDLPEEDASV